MESNIWGEGLHCKANYYSGERNLSKFDGIKISSLDLTIIMQDVTNRNDIKELREQLEILEDSLEDK